MKRIVVLLCSIMGIFSIVSCGANTESQASSEVQIANPWKSFNSLNDAEAYAGFELEMPETISDTYVAITFGVLQGEKPLLQVAYQNDEYEVEVRKSKGNGQDISGIYGFENTDTIEKSGVKINVFRPSDESDTPNAILETFDYNGFSWSLYAPNGFVGDSGDDFLISIFGE